MLNENEFKDRAAGAIEDLEDRILPFADQHDFEVEGGEGILTLIFEKPAHTKFIVSPNSPARQIWVSALSTSYKFDWDEAAVMFVLDKTREPFLQVIASLIEKQIGVAIRL